MKRVIQINSLICCILASFNATAHDFSAFNNDGKQIFYQITSPTEVAVTFGGSSPNAYDEYMGDIVIPDSVWWNGTTYTVTAIKGNAFAYSDNLLSVTIPASVTDIEYAAFHNCIALTAINTDANNTAFSSTDGVLYTKTADTLIKCPEGKAGHLAIPQGCEVIGYESVWSCWGITSADIPNSVKVIDFGAFMWSGLDSISIPNSVEKIGHWAFYNCLYLTSIVIPNSVKSMGYFAFSACESLKSAIISDFLDTIQESTFYSCINLESVTIGQYVKIIEHFAFYQCNALKGTLIIPDSVKKIGTAAFANNWLTELIIGSSVISIDAAAFGGCSEIGSITCYALTPPAIHTQTFQHIPTTIPVNVPCQSLSSYKQAAYWNAFSNIRAIETDCDLSIEATANTSITIYPNPARKLINIVCKNEINSIEIVDILGKRKWIGKLPTIDVSKFAKGIYFIKVYTDKGTTMKKIIVN